MHPCYVLIHADDYWAFNQRPHGLVELVLGDRELSFPCTLPQMINFPILQAFLAPLVTRELACITLNVWHNGAALDFRLVNCFDGFFVQVIINVGRTIMDNSIMAAPIVTPQIHIDPLVLPDPQSLQITAFVPGGDILISSRSVTMVQRRDRIFAVLDMVLRQRCPDMLHVGFVILGQHVYGPSLATVENTVVEPNGTGGTTTKQVTALGLSKATHEFLTLHYFAIDSAEWWERILNGSRAL